MGKDQDAKPGPKDAAHDPPAPAYQPVDPANIADAQSPGRERETLPVPSIASPFTFPPADTKHPLVIPGEPSGLIAFPQVRPGPHPVLSAYSPVLLRHGITQRTWTSFLDTISAFLAARVPKRFVSHAADMARDITAGPIQSGRNLAAHARDVGNDISASAGRGSFFGVVGNVLEAAIFLPIAVTFGVIGAALSLPGSAIAAAFRRPKTPFERASNYVTVANQHWLHQRKLHAQLMDTSQLARAIHASPEELLKSAVVFTGSPSSGQLDTLHPRLEAIDCRVEDVNLQLDMASLWLVVMQIDLDKPPHGIPTDK
ncbi:hypothetical protein ESCO_000482 [Escovopsis weberi]|uniref:Uncharacterized protein n=1 Tax=Escovopsis weberi TaxID=150374 RepID=A0A0M8MV47_ESCWE|nr:hypothetical protein ESCO_000482 [Escovopsis weberi]